MEVLSNQWVCWHMWFHLNIRGFICSSQWFWVAGAVSHLMDESGKVRNFSKDYIGRTGTQTRFSGSSSMFFLIQVICMWKFIALEKFIALCLGESWEEIKALFHDLHLPLNAVTSDYITRGREFSNFKANHVSQLLLGLTHFLRK